MANPVRGEVEDTERDAKSQIPVGSGDDHCLKALNAFLFNSNDENAREAMNYLCCIGWKIDEDKLCYTSPGNIKYGSLTEVCKYLTQGSSSSNSESRALVLHEKEREKVSCPQVVVDWYISVSAEKRKAPRTLSSQVKQYLLTAGWKLQYIHKNSSKNKTKRELRYISPKGHTHISLVRACKEIMGETAGNNTSHQPSTASHGMQSQVHNQGLSQISLQSQSQARQQLSSQNLQNTIVNAGVRSSATLLPALPSMTSLTQTSMPNSAGQRINMQSGIAQNFVGSSVSQGVPSMISLQSQSQARQQLSSQNLQNTIVNAGVRSSATLLPALPSMTSLTQTSMPNSAGQRINMQSEIAQNFVGSSVSQGVPSMIFSKKQLQHQISKQKLHGNIQSSVMQSHIQLQPLQQPQNLLQPTQMSNAVGRSTNMPHQILSSSMDSEAHTEQNAVDWQEEIYPKIQVMKEKYLADLNKIYHKVSRKCKQHDDSDLNVPESELIEKLKAWKIKLESIIHPFYVSKKKIVPGMMEADLNEIYHEVSTICEQIIDVLNSSSPRKPVSAQQEIQQPGGHPLSNVSMQTQQQEQQQEQQQQQTDNQRKE